MTGTFLIGKAATGKSRFAKWLSRQEKTQTINGRNLRAGTKSYALERLFWNVKPETSLLIIDDVPKNYLRALVPLLFCPEIISEYQGKAPVYVSPKIIVTCECDFKDLDFGASFFARFTVIECLKSEDHSVNMVFHHPKMLDRAYAGQPTKA